MKIIYSILLLCYAMQSSALAGDDAPAELIEFHQLKDVASQAYRDKNWLLSYDTALDAAALRPLHPSIIALILRSAQKMGDEKAADDAMKRLEAQGLDFIRPLKNLPPLGVAKSYYVAAKAGRLPESLAISNEKIFIGYVADRAITSNDNSITLDMRGSPLGMAVESEKNRLWVSTGILPQSDLASGGDGGGASLLEVDLAKMDIAERYHTKDKSQVFGSVAITDSGKIFTSDSKSASLLELKGGEIIKVAGHNGKGSFQGIAPIGDTVYTADYSNGIYRYDIKSGKSGYLANKSSYSLITIDGLAPYKDNQLIAIQNGLWPHRVLRLFIDGDVVRCVDILASGLPEFDEPTNGIVKGSEFIFIANSQWPKFADPANLPQAGDMNPAHILSIDIEKAPSTCLAN